MTGVTVFPAAREEGQAVNMAHCTCPATQDTQKERKEIGKLKRGRWRWLNERLTRERGHFQKIKHLITLNKLSPLSYSEIPVCLTEVDIIIHHLKKKKKNVN